MKPGRETEGPVVRSAVLNTEQAAAYLGLAKSTLEKLRIYGDGPMYLKYSKAVRYLLEDLEFWLARRRAANTSVAERLSATRYPSGNSKVSRRRTRNGLRRVRR